MSLLPDKHIPVWQWWLVSLLPFVLYANVLAGDHGYVLDDAIVLTENQFTRQGVAGIGDIFSHETFVGFFGEQKELVAGSRYRPLSLASFAVEVSVFGFNPWLSHFFNVVLYALTGLLFFGLLWELVRVRWPQYRFQLPLLATLLFMVHPLHTEVVANIKGRDELFSLLFGLWAAVLSIQWVDRKKPLALVWLSVAWLAALFSKENAFTLLPVIPALLWVARPQVALRQVAAPVGVMALLAALALLVRVQVVGGFGGGAPITELLNNPFVQADTVSFYATVLYTWGKYLQLLVWPATLSHDYYPFQIALTSFGNPWVIVCVLVVSISLIAMVWGLARRHPIGVALLWWWATFSVVSNLVFPVGTFLSERLVYMPSVGFSLLVGWGILPFLNQSDTGTWRSWWRAQLLRPLPFLILIIALSVLSARTIARNPVWQSNETLFLTDVQQASNSVKLLHAAGGVLYDKSQLPGTLPQAQQSYLAEAKGYLERAVSLYPGYGDAWKTLGNVYFFLNRDYESAMNAYRTAGSESAYMNMFAIGQRAQQFGDLLNAAYCYRQFLQVMPGYKEGWVALATVLTESAQGAAALEVVNTALQQFPDDPDLLLKGGLAAGQGMGDLRQAVQWFERVIAVAPEKAEGYENMGVAYAMMGQPAPAIRYMEQALVYNPTNKQTHANLATAYAAVGNQAKAEYHLQQAK